MLLVLLPSLAWSAKPQPVVALGDGIVVPAAAAASPEVGGDTASGGWVAVLADCLQERAPGRFAVVDRARAGETLVSVKDKLADVRELGPAWVVVTLGARELAAPDADPQAVGADLAAVVGRLREGRGASVVVVGPVPPTLPDAERQAAVDAKVKAFDEAAAALAASTRGVFVVDPLSEWLASTQPRAGLVATGGGLSDQGQAKIAASVCDVVLSQR